MHEGVVCTLYNFLGVVWSHCYISCGDGSQHAHDIARQIEPSTLHKVYETLGPGEQVAARDNTTDMH